MPAARQIPLVECAGARGVLPVLAYLGVAIVAVTAWVQAGMVYAMVELARQGGDVPAVRALFALGETMQTTDSIGVALALGGASWLALPSRKLPPILAGSGVGVAALHLVEGFVQTQGAGVAGPIGVVLGLLWMLATGVFLVVRPARRRRPEPGAATQPA